MPTRSTRCGLLLLPVLLLSTLAAQANPSILNNWRNQYPSSLSADNAGDGGCPLCHNGGNVAQWSAYGNAVRQNGFDFLAVEALNSDGDPGGTSNLAEILAGTQPGWTIGANNSVYNDLGMVDMTGLEAPASILGDLDPAPMPVVSIPTLGETALLLTAMLLMLAGLRYSGRDPA